MAKALASRVSEALARCNTGKAKKVVKACVSRQIGIGKLSKANQKAARALVSEAIGEAPKAARGRKGKGSALAPVSCQEAKMMAAACERVSDGASLNGLRRRRRRR